MCQSIRRHHPGIVDALHRLTKPAEQKEIRIEAKRMGGNFFRTNVGGTNRSKPHGR
jgi:hypothetical protein